MCVLREEPALVEPVAAPDIYFSGAAKVEMIDDRVICVTIYRNDCHERIVVARLILPVSALSPMRAKIDAAVAAGMMMGQEVPARLSS